MARPSTIEARQVGESLAPPTKLRWEWRSFGRRFGGAEARIAQLSASDPAESDEVYFLSAHGDNVKVRDDLMDIKSCGRSTRRASSNGRRC
jgi:hypothetical protein